MIGLTRLPPSVSVPLPPEIQVRLAQPIPSSQPPVADEAKPVPQPSPKLADLARPEPKPVFLPAPQPAAPVVAPLPEAPPVPAQTVSVPPPSRAAPGPEVSIPLLVDKRFYIARELDVQPSALRRPEPVYPYRAQEQGVPGRVVIRLHLESDGSVSKTEVVSVSPGGVFGEMFRQSTLDAVMGMRFRPAQRNGQPVRAVVEIPVVFEPGR